MADDASEVLKRIQAAPDPSAQGIFDRLKSETAKPAEPQTSAGAGLWEGLKQGVIETGQGMAQLASRMPTMLPGAAAGQQRMQADIGQRIGAGQQAYRASPAVQQHPWAAGAGRVLGQAAPSLAAGIAMPGVGAMGMGARAALGAAGGAAGAAMQPVTGGDYWTEKTKQAGTGAAAGGTLGAAGAAIGPPLSQIAQSAIAKFPHIASLVRGTAMRSPDNFNRAAVNQALDPIKTVIPATVKAGHDLINEGRAALSDAYNKVLPGIQAIVDSDLSTALAGIKAYTGSMAKDKHEQLVKYIENHFEAKVAAKGGALDGKTIKEIESEFGNRAARYVKSPDADQQALGDGIYDAREAIMDAVARQNGPQAAALKSINQAYAMFSRVREASGRNVDSLGVFTPHDLLAAARGANKGAFVNGDAAMQAVGEAMLGPMSAPKVNRILSSILGGAAGQALRGPMGGAIGAGIGAAAPDVLKGAVRATQTPIARAVGEGVSRAAPAAGETAREAYVSTVGP